MSESVEPIETGSRLILTESRWLRFSTLTGFYLAQGIPLGLLDLALPAWLAQAGYSPAAIAGYATAIGLPWAFKLIAGPFMDRFQFRPMGFRRPWVIALQTGLLSALALMAFVPDLTAQIALLTAIGFMVNTFAATQDVAVDGLAIDVLPIEERGRANAFMAFGQVAGLYGFGGLAGVMLVTWGLSVTAMTAAGLVGLIWIVSILVRERRGERRMPWSVGESARTDVAKPTVKLLFADLWRGLKLPMSLLLSAVNFFGRLSAGVTVVVVPVFAVQELGFGTDDYSQAAMVMGVTAAIIGLGVGPLIDRIGAKKSLAIGLIGKALVLGIFGVTAAWWSSGAYVVTMLFFFYVTAQVFFVALIAQHMNITWVKVAATQFAVYMAFANLSRSAGSGLYGLVSDSLTYPEVFLAAGGISVIAALILIPFNQNKHRADLDKLEEQSA